LSLAALLTKTEVTAKFFEQKAEFNWHKGMILPNTTLQVPFMADLVTLIDPTSPYSFLNYLHTQQRLLKFYFLEEFKIYRKEYNHYCQWVAGQLDSLSFDATVIDVAFDDSNDGFVVTVCEQGIQNTYHAKNLVIGTGTQATLPLSLQDIAKQAPNRCMHTAHFADSFDLDSLKPNSGKVEEGLPKILVLGSGQSSAEVYRTLFDQQFDGDDSTNDNPKFQLDWMTRSAGFFPMEYSPLGLEHFSPAYTDYFYHLDSVTKPQI
uniref:SidA/IucD/PvdA family monooxygenase n=2 Tax=Moraxellaceae TaxID=468 RepID=UPI001919DB59